MQAVGINCEYNPLHSGHVHQLEQLREADTVICLMSGNFTQRGEAALLPPTARAEMALRAGADLVLELPFPFSCGSARYFATAGVRALAAMGCDTLSFGSETADGESLLTAAAHLNSAEFSESMQSRTPNTGDAAAHFAALGDTPASNDILALEYTRAILEEQLPLKIAPILREGAGYLQSSLGEGHPSATALRAQLAAGADITAFLPSVVQESWKKAGELYGGTADIRALGSAMLARLRAGDLPQDIADCGGGLMAHLAGAAAYATDYASLCREAATKRYTHGRIRRALLYLLAGVRREDLIARPYYLRLLGANETGRAYLAKTRKTRTVSVVTKPSDIAALGEEAARQRELSAVADGLYALCLPRPIPPHALATAAPVLL